MIKKTENKGVWHNTKENVKEKTTNKQYKKTGQSKKERYEKTGV